MTDPVAPNGDIGPPLQSRSRTTRASATRRWSPWSFTIDLPTPVAASRSPTRHAPSY